MYIKKTINIFKGNNSMEKTFLTLTVMTLFVLGTAGIAFAATPTGAGLNTSSAETYSPTVYNQTIQGGYVQEVNITGYSLTGKWAGFFGSVAGGIQLADSSGNRFISWTLSNPAGSSVYACNDTGVAWSGLTAAGSANMPAFLGSGIDSYTATFSASESQSWANSGSFSANYTRSYDNTGNPSDNFKTYSLRDAANSILIWATKAVNNASGFNTNTVDYQLLVPADSSGLNYYFYLEIA